MTELVQVREGKIGDANTLVVDARELHAALGVGKDFSTWIKSRIKQYGFVEHQDYVTAKNLRSPISGSSKAREQVAIDYYITLDMAKELAMVERNEKGRGGQEVLHRVRTPSLSGDQGKPSAGRQANGWSVAVGGQAGGRTCACARAEVSDCWLHRGVRQSEEQAKRHLADGRQSGRIDEPN